MGSGLVLLVIAGVGDEAVFLYPPEVDLINDVLSGEGTQSLLFQPLKGNFICGRMNLSIDFVTPGQSLAVQICEGDVLDHHHKIIPHKLNCPRYGRQRMGLNP